MRRHALTAIVLILGIALTLSGLAAAEDITSLNVSDEAEVCGR